MEKKEINKNNPQNNRGSNKNLEHQNKNVKSPTSKKPKDDYKTKYIKLLAEMENLRKRFDEERTEIIKFRATSFIQDILPTLDMFEMALSSKDVSSEIKNWLMGFEMILNNFNSTLSSEGVTEIKVSVGEEFNSNYHQAIDEVVTNKIKPGNIANIKSKGYLLHGRLLRPVTVVVAKEESKIQK